MQTTMSPSGGYSIPPGVEFPSQRRERIDWHKLASVDLHDLASGCPIEILQENLTQVAFCDADTEFDLRTSSGQRNLLKMFRLAQLTVQYLFLSQDFMETQLKEAQEETQQAVEKYQQVKVKLVQQVEEAKKMKTSNKNMRETVKHINSLALANGIFQALQCPLCPKTFRTQDFLRSHLWRKHPTQAVSVSLPQVTQVPPAVSVSLPQVTQVPPAASSHVLGVFEGRQEEPPGPSSATFPPTVPSVSTFSSPKVNNASTFPTSIPTTTVPKVNDVDSYRLNEIERKCDTMNENFAKIIKEMEEQKRLLQVDNDRKQEEVRKAWEEKNTMEKHYETQLERLSEQIFHLQSAGIDRVVPPPADNEGLLELIRRQEEELKSLQEKVQAQATSSRVEEIRTLDDVDGLPEELQALKRQLNQQEKLHRQSMKRMKESLQRDYERTLDTEKTKIKDMMKDIAHDEAAIAVITHKPPPSPKTPKSREPPVPNLATKPSMSVPQGVVESGPTTSHPQHKQTKETKPTPQPRPRLIRETQTSAMDPQETETESESETDTSYWNQSNLKVKQLQISSSSVEKDNEAQSPSIQEKDSQQHRQTSDESTEESSHLESEVSSESLKLDILLKDNPQLWSQMKEATSEVLASRLASLGIDPSAHGIKQDTLTSCLYQLRKERRTLDKKYENFHDLRKRLENEVTAKVDDKIDEAGDMPDEMPLKSHDLGRIRHPGVISRMVKNVQSKVKERSRALSSSVSKTGESVKSGVRDMFHARGSDDVQVFPGAGRRVSATSVEDVRDGKSSPVQEDSIDSDSELESSSARVEVHNETTNSVKRSLFSQSPIASGSGTRPKCPGGYFDNMTYGKADEQDSDSSRWESEPEYENLKEEPPKRSDSLNLSLESVDLHSNTRRQPNVESHPIRVKKPRGDKVSGLTQTIELQLSGRKKPKLAGAVDITKTFEKSTRSPIKQLSTTQSSSQGSQDAALSMSDSSNTVGTSMWGSAEGINRTKQQATRPKTAASTSRATVHSWDSKDDLDISDLE